MTNYTIRALLWVHKADSYGCHPLMVAVTIKRKVTYRKTAFRLKKDQWENGQIVNSANANLMNATLRKEMADIEKELLLLTLDDAKINIKKILKGDNPTDFYHFVNQVRPSHPATLINHNKEINRLIEYRPRLLLTDVDPSFLRDYERYHRERGKAQNTINSTFKWLRKIMNQAYKENVIKATPFKAYSVPKYHQAERPFLTESERHQWFDFWEHKKVDGPVYITLTWFMLSMFTGLRHQDLCVFDYNKRVEGDIIRLRARKNKQWVVLPIGKSLSKVIEVIKTIPRPFSTSKSNTHLKIVTGILESKKHITCHTFRHTFASMCAELKIPKSVTAELMGINDATVNIYYHLTGQNIVDQAAVLKTI